MRELKFRIWNIQEKIYEDLMYVIGISPDCKWIYFKEPNEPVAIYADTIRKNYVIEQSTGLKDKNGKEIYEGDILSFENEKSLARVLWLKEKAMFGLKWLDCGVEDELDYWSVCKGPVEVIGNIHENKELLDV